MGAGIISVQRIILSGKIVCCNKSPWNAIVLWKVSFCLGTVEELVCLIKELVWLINVKSNDLVPIGVEGKPLLWSHWIMISFTVTCSTHQRYETLSSKFPSAGVQVLWKSVNSTIHPIPTLIYSCISAYWQGWEEWHSCFQPVSIECLHEKGYSYQVLLKGHTILFPPGYQKNCISLRCWQLMCLMLPPVSCAIIICCYFIIFLMKN